MTKRQLIDEIMQLNRSARPEFLARFGDDELNDYLRHLRKARRPRQFWSAGQFDRYFASLVAPRPRQAAGRLDLASLVNRATTALMPDLASGTAVAEGPYVDEYPIEDTATPLAQTWPDDLANEEAQLEDTDVADDAEAIDAKYAHGQTSDEAGDADPVDEFAEEEDENFLVPAAMDDATSVELPPLEPDELAEEESAEQQDQPQTLAEHELGIAEPRFNSTPEGIQEAFLF